jgi:RNA polymerase sigma-70 factor (ECF subfamily)
MDADDDFSLAERIASGNDPQAEAELCRRWFPRIRAYGRLHLGAEAGDLAQEVLLVLLRALRERRVTDVHRLSAYVSGVCRNMTREWRIGERRRSMLLERLGPTLSEVTAPPPPIERLRLIECLKKLSVRDRAVVVLTFYADKDGDEIARELEMSVGNVRVTRHRALKQLLDCIGVEA